VQVNPLRALAGQGQGQVNLGSHLCSGGGAKKNYRLAHPRNIPKQSEIIIPNPYKRATKPLEIIFFYEEII